MKNKKNNSPFKAMVIVTLVVILGLVALAVMNNNDSNSSHDLSFEKQPPVEGQPLIGDVNAPVTVVEFGDFKCPACKVWGETIFPQLIADYVEPGKVKFAYINVLFHGEESKTGSLAAEHVFKQSPEDYWAFHKEIFNHQPPTQNHDDLWLTKDKVIEVASNYPKIDINQLKESLEKETEIAEVEKDMVLVKEYKVQLTPSIMVNGTMLEDPFDYEKIKSLIEKELQGK
ncbi:DsbA family protein [Ammoniphilus sp. CFH 90114]|uniref:DsbA family protein n=1 Tax=Ammoniphilus sp. CFH 90114 TaxID=2493665 RepID=UPI00100DB8DF|nr:DsbA family protein [Ammoniphilus sp. CFH 90114]RXT03906.1 DsbA family protein [Ammoniphilus sp. CFH 90114]